MGRENERERESEKGVIVRVAREREIGKVRVGKVEMERVCGENGKVIVGGVRVRGDEGWRENVERENSVSEESMSVGT